MNQIVQEFINQHIWAVVGFSQNPSKYGHIVYHHLLNSGYRVFPVNNRKGSAEGLELYASLTDLPEIPEVASLIVPPAETDKVVRQCAEIGLKRVWMQPGAESIIALNFCRDHGIKVVHGACVLMEIRA